MLDVHRLRLLCELDRRGTLAAVARALSYSPSAVSQQLSQLEAETGVTLLEPAGRGVRLTAQARILVAHAEAVFERLEEAEAELRASLTEVRGTLRVASFQSVLLALVPEVLTDLAGRYPGLRVEITHQEEGPGLRRPARPRVRHRPRRGVPGDRPAAGGGRPHPAAGPRRAASHRPGPRSVRPARRRGAGPAGRPGRYTVDLRSGRHRDRALGAQRLPGGGLRARRPLLGLRPAAAAPPGGDRARGRDAAGTAAGGRAGPAARVGAMPGRPRRRLTTGVRAGAAADPAIRAFRAALRRAIRSAAPGIGTEPAALTGDRGSAGDA